MGDTKSISPPTSVSEVSADTAPEPLPAKMVVEEASSGGDANNVVERLDVKEDTVNTEIPADPPEPEDSEMSQDEPPTDITPSPPTDDKVIPRLVNTSVPLDVLNTVDPEHWTTDDVAKFLTVNDCQPYCINFTNITGPMMLQLTKDEIIELLEMKVGPSLKIFDLIQQLKCKIKQPQCRLLGSYNK